MRRVIAVLVLAVLTLSACDNAIRVHLPAPSVTAIVTGSTTAPLTSADGTAQLHVVTGFTAVTITIGAIGADLFRASTPLNSGGAVNAAVTGNIVTVAGSSSGGSVNAVQILLSPKPRWLVSLDAGTNVSVIDLSGGQVAGVELNQGASSLEITLPEQGGTTPVSIAAGVSQLRVHVRGRDPVRATLSAGAGSVSVDGSTHSGIAAGSTFGEPGWDSATNRVDIQCSAGVSSLVVDRG